MRGRGGETRRMPSRERMPGESGLGGASIYCGCSVVDDGYCIATQCVYI